LYSIDDSPPTLEFRRKVEFHAWNTDNYRDLEFVDVEGSGIFSDARDNPHKDEWWADNDDPHYEFNGRKFTAFNHFIDIKKGHGTFDDYDGYSYKRGSASRNEYQDMSELIDVTDIESGAAFIFTELGNMKVDEAINYYFNDEYAHAPGHKWYRRGRCSPALERYSFPEDKGKYNSVDAECKARFPMAEATGHRNRGISWSVFMPVDNMARYWYSEFLETKNPNHLGPVMHAIQDASVPHHAAGYNGNWHTKYEGILEESKVPNWLRDASFTNDVKELFAKWNRVDNSPPSRLNISDWVKEPAINWRIDHLVTWVALNAYLEYCRTYDVYRRDDFRFNESGAMKLVKIATAMSLLVLKKVAHLFPSFDVPVPTYPIGRVISSSPIRLAWLPVPGAASHTVEFQKSSGELIKRKSGIRTNVYSFPGELFGRYRWRVWAVGADGKAGPKCDFVYVYYYPYTPGPGPHGPDDPRPHDPDDPRPHEP
jgi:hypothetical protein